MSHERPVIVSHTESLCPVCLAKLPAVVFADRDMVSMRKACPEHGEFRTPLWRGDPAYGSWSRPKVPFQASHPATETTDGCPFDCGLCPDHRQQTCTAIIEVTSRCNLSCAFCFANAGGSGTDDPDLSRLRALYESVLAGGYLCNVQLSGGEPTLRDDLPEIVALGRSMGFEFIQVNTNGIRFATDLHYVEKLKNAGLASVFLQFDGTHDSIYQALRGRNLFETKAQAIRNCRRMDLGVVLVPTLVPAVNVDHVGEIIHFAVENLPTVRGVHFQPVTYVGRYPGTRADAARLTLPEVMRSIELQTRGLIRTDHFRPPRCEHALCSFHGNFVAMPDGQLIALTTRQDGPCSCNAEKAELGAARTRQCVAEQWSSVNHQASGPTKDDFSMGLWDLLLQRARTHTLSVSAMAFQDAWNVDLERLKDCCIHVAEPDGRLIPFCAYNVTGISGRSLYRKRQRL